MRIVRLKKRNNRNMYRLFSLLTILLSTAFFVLSIVYLIARTFGQLAWNPESKAFKRLLDLLRSRLHAQSAGLVPWDREMLGLLSLNRVNEKKAGWFNPVSSGQFTSIYQEPVLAYITQSSGKLHLTVARTSDREFILRRQGNQTEIWLNGQPFALFADGALLASGRESKLLARLENRPDEAQSPLLLGNTTAVALSNPARPGGPNPRALTILRELSIEEENIALAIFLVNNVIRH